MQGFKEINLNHYYGDIVRGIFLVSAAVMLVGLPAVSVYLHISPTLSVFTVLILGLAAGFTNPKMISSAIINVIISSIGFVVFESYTVRIYGQAGDGQKYMLANLVLGLMFLLSIYFSVKTLRALLLQKADEKEDPETLL